MDFYKTLSSQYVTGFSEVDTDYINYSSSINALHPLTDLQKDLLEKVFKLAPYEPVRDVLQEFNRWVNSSFHLFENQVEHPGLLEVWEFPWELVYEIVRADFYPSLPKRSDSYFVFNKIEDAINWKKRRSDYILCKVGVKELREIFTGDMYYLDCVEVDASFSEITESVSKYWQGSVSNNPIIETLIQGVITLEKI